MKILGIAMLFLLCIGVGFGKAAAQQARVRTLRAVQKDVRQLLGEIRLRHTTLTEAASLLQEGVVRAKLTGSGDRVHRGMSEAEIERLDRFLALLGRAGLQEIATAGESYLAELASLLEEAEQKSKSAGLYRSVGALSGAILAVLLW